MSIRKKTGKFNAIQFLQDKPTFVEDSVQEINSVERLRVKSIQDEREKSLQNAKERFVKKFAKDPILSQTPLMSEYFSTQTGGFKERNSAQSVKLLKPIPQVNDCESPFMTQSEIKRHQITQEDIKNNLIYKFHDAIHQSMVPKFDITLTQVESTLLTIPFVKDHLIKVIDLFYDHKKSELTKDLQRFITDQKNEFEYQMHVTQYIHASTNLNGQNKTEFFNTLSKQRMMTMNLSVWIQEQLLRLEEDQEKLMINELFQKTYVILTASQMELSRQMSQYLSSIQFSKLKLIQSCFNNIQIEEWSQLQNTIFRMSMNTFHKATQMFFTNQKNIEDQQHQRFETLHNIYQAKLDDMIRREAKLIEEVEYLNEKFNKQSTLFRYIRKKCLKYQVLNQVLHSEHQTLTDEIKLLQQKNETFSQTLQNLTEKIQIPQSRQLLEGEESEKTISNMNNSFYASSKFQKSFKKDDSDDVLQKQSSIVQFLQSDQNKRKNMLKKPQEKNTNTIAHFFRKENENFKVVTPVNNEQEQVIQTPESPPKNFQVDKGNENIEQELFFQNNQDLVREELTGEVEDKCLNTSISLNRGTDVAVQCSKDMQQFYQRDKSTQVQTLKCDQYSQCDLFVSEIDERKLIAIAQEKELTNRQKLQTIRSLHDDKDEIALRKQRRKELLAQAPQIHIIEVQSRLDKKIFKVENSFSDSLNKVMQIINIHELHVTNSRYLNENSWAKIKEQLNDVRQILESMEMTILIEKRELNENIYKRNLLIIEKDLDKLKFQKQLIYYQKQLFQTSLQLENLKSQNSLSQEQLSKALLSYNLLDFDDQIQYHELDNSIQDNLLSRSIRNIIKLDVVSNQIRYKKQQKTKIQPQKHAFKFNALQIIIFQEPLKCNVNHRSFRYNYINQMVHYLKLLVDCPQPTIENIFRTQKAVFNKILIDHLNEKEATFFTFEEYLFHYLEEKYNETKKVTQIFIDIFMMMNNSKKDSILLEFCSILSADQYSSIQGRLKLYTISDTLAKFFIEENLSSGEVFEKFLELLQKAFELNRLNFVKDELNFEGIAADLVQTIYRSKESLKNIYEKRRPSLDRRASLDRRRSSLIGTLIYDEGSDIENLDQKKQSFDLQIRSHITHQLMSNCLKLVHQQDQRLRNLIEFISSDTLQNSVTFEEMGFITVVLVGSFYRIPDYLRAFQRKIHQDQTGSIKFESRIGYCDFRKILLDNHLLQKLEAIYQKRAQIKIIEYDSFLKGQMITKDISADNFQELFKEWDEIQRYLKARLYQLNIIQGMPQDLLYKLNMILKKCVYDEEYGFNIPLEKQETLVLVFKIITEYSNVMLIEENIYKLLPSEFDFFDQLSDI